MAVILPQVPQLAKRDLATMRVGGRSGGGFPHCIFQRGGGEVGHDAAAGGQLQAEAYEQFGHPALGARDAAQSHVRHLLAAAHGQPKALSLPTVSRMRGA